jgi:hypothetical protein
MGLLGLRASPAVRRYRMWLEAVRSLRRLVKLAKNGHPYNGSSGATLPEPLNATRTPATPTTTQSGMGVVDERPGCQRCQGQGR